MVTYSVAKKYLKYAYVRVLEFEWPFRLNRADLATPTPITHPISCKHKGSIPNTST